jgi:hypothetical protein
MEGSFHRRTFFTFLRQVEWLLPRSVSMVPSSSAFSGGPAIPSVILDLAVAGPLVP